MIKLTHISKIKPGDTIEVGGQQIELFEGDIVRDIAGTKILGDCFDSGKILVAKVVRKSVFRRLIDKIV